jgi:hypothetical protein
VKSSVLGFVFDQVLQNVLLVSRKAEWTAGRLDGVGGEVGLYESREAAMARHFEGAVHAALFAFSDRRLLRDLSISKWQEFACLRDSLQTVWVYCAVARLDRLSEAGSFGAEGGKLVVVSARDLSKEVVALKLLFLVPMALSCLRDGDGTYIEVVETRRGAEESL